MDILRRDFLNAGLAGAVVVVAYGEAEAATVATAIGTAQGAIALSGSSWIQGSAIYSAPINISTLSPEPLDIEFTVKGTASTTALANQLGVNVWLAITEDGTTWSEPDLYSGTTNYTATLRQPSNFIGPNQIHCTVSLAFAEAMTLRQFNLPTMPREVAFVLENQTGQIVTGPVVTWTPVNNTVL